MPIGLFGHIWTRSLGSCCCCCATFSLLCFLRTVTWTWKQSGNRSSNACFSCRRRDNAPLRYCCCYSHDVSSLELTPINSTLHIASFLFLLFSPPSLCIRARMYARTPTGRKKLWRCSLCTSLIPLISSCNSSSSSSCESERASERVDGGIFPSGFSSFSCWTRIIWPCSSS